MTWRPVTIADRAVFARYLPKLDTVLSEYCFGSLFFWRKAYNFRWRTLADCLVVSAVWQDEEYCLMPFGHPDDQRRAIGELVVERQLVGRALTLRMVDRRTSELLARWWPETEIAADRDNFDYWHSRAELSALRGRRYESRRNHINRFIRQNPGWRVYPLWPELAGDCWEAYRGWEGGNQPGATLVFEREAISEVLPRIDQLGWLGCVLTVGGKVVAFSAGETIGRAKDTV
ncbi:MAG: phosphatidylglycerol lysyltransferase domain-containing protein, partial [Negativicutes bacterium]|nr:phosphatidylglycerol lysyltransferase domain-containing protein [Negativicutes bacterium]